MPDLMQHEPSQQRRVLGLKQDLAKCFDNTSSRQATAVLTRYGPPKQIAKLLLYFYNNHVRWLEIDGCASPDPLRPTRSILQGCPFSVLLLSGLMTLWASQLQINFPQLRLGVYIDDRTLWMKNSSIATLQKVVEHSDKLDSIFEFKSSKDKEASFANSSALRRKLKVLGNSYNWFSLLGIHYQRFFSLQIAPDAGAAN